MKNYGYKFAVIFFSAFLLMAPMVDISHNVLITDVPKKSLHNAREIILANGNKAYTVMDLRYSNKTDPFFTDLLLSFDQKASEYWKDDTGKYEVFSSNYRFVKSGEALGGGCASFYKNDHAIEVKTAPGLWLGSYEDLGSFNIEFRFKASEIREGSVFFSRIGYFSGISKGIEITMREGVVVAYLYNIFQTSSGQWKSVVLSRGRSIRSGVWYHFCLSYDRSSGKLVKYLQGEEEDVLYLTETGFPFEGTFIPAFGHRKNIGDDYICHDLPLVTIGLNYSGFIDEFRISHLSMDNLKETTDVAIKKYAGSKYVGTSPYNREGVITSPVYSFKGTGTSVTEFSWEDSLPKDTFVWMEFRISDLAFNDSDSNIKWYRVSKGERNIFLKKTDSGLFLRGKYYQWRAHLIPSPDGDSAPFLSSVNIEYRLDKAPVVPMFLEVENSGDGHVLLKWKKNVDHDIGGYRIYYGTVRGRYDGILSIVQGRKIDNTIGNGNFVQIKVDNTLIDENRKADKRKLLVYPAIENRVLYFFAVSSYDSYRVGSVYNHESELSQPVSARPYAGSEIK